MNITEPYMSTLRDWLINRAPAYKSACNKIQNFKCNDCCNKFLYTIISLI